MFSDNISVLCASFSCLELCELISTFALVRCRVSWSAYVFVVTVHVRDTVRMRLTQTFPLNAKYIQGFVQLFKLAINITMAIAGPKGK